LYAWNASIRVFSSMLFSIDSRFSCCNKSEKWYVRLALKAMRLPCLELVAENAASISEPLQNNVAIAKSADD